MTAENLKARESAFLAVLGSLKETSFVSDSLSDWQARDNPSQKDFALAYEIAQGSVKRFISLQYLALKLSGRERISLKLKEKALIATALYQFFFMDKIPLYAIVNETVEIAKKQCHSTFVKFLNALLRNLEKEEFGFPDVLSKLLPKILPESTSTKEVSLKYSYPVLFIQKLLKQFELAKVIEILEEGNKPPQLFVKCLNNENQLDSGITFDPEMNQEGIKRIGRLTDSAQVLSFVKNPLYYVQNATPIALVDQLASYTKEPAAILDLCASPGGKLLLAAEHFPKASLFGNDVSDDKLFWLKENLDKYGLKATLTCGKGQYYKSEKAFDLVILDVPCSNTGVLNKRAEARWRITEEKLKELKILQQELLKRSLELIRDKGSIWYMTCSILQEENEKFIEEFCKKNSCKIVFKRLYIPSSKGWDGGFGALITRD